MGTALSRLPCVCRTASSCAFQVKKRSMRASDMIEYLGTAVEMLFEVAGSGGGAAGGAGMGDAAGRM